MSRTWLSDRYIKKGKAYTMKNLSTFMEIFGQNINRSLLKLRQEELTSGETAAAANKDLRTQMCFLLLSAENASDYIDVSLCSGLMLEASEPGGPESITITGATYSADLSDRACTFREYFRQSDIFQKWGIKQ